MYVRVMTVMYVLCVMTADAEDVVALMCERERERTRRGGSRGEARAVVSWRGGVVVGGGVTHSLVATRLPSSSSSERAG